MTSVVRINRATKLRVCLTAKAANSVGKRRSSSYITMQTTQLERMTSVVRTNRATKLRVCLTAKAANSMENEDPPAKGVSCYYMDNVPAQFQPGA